MQDGGFSKTILTHAVPTCNLSSFLKFEKMGREFHAISYSTLIQNNSNISAATGKYRHQFTL